MKKLLLSSAALCGLAMVATPASAQVKLDLGGHFKGYAFFSDQDEDTGVAGESRSFDIIRSTEVHFGGETTLDNGLTVGMHIETEADGGPSGQDGFEVQESYAYFSGAWGRVNLGGEDGASYLLQVAAPSADSNLDGIRQYVNPVNYVAMGLTAANAVSLAGTTLDVNGARGGLDYDQDLSGYEDKITYLSPVMNGLQLGMSYTPDLQGSADEDALDENEVAGAMGAVYEAAIRYEGNFNNVGMILGAGYTKVDQEADDTATTLGRTTDDRQAWNVGADFDIGAFGVGVTYLKDDYGTRDRSGANPSTAHTDDERTWVVGVDYTTGPFKIGGSYMNIHDVASAAGLNATEGVDATRWTGGVVYTYGPGMTFRGSVSQVELDNVDLVTAAGEDSVDATTILFGTQINF